MKQQKLTLYMSIPGMLDDKPTIDMLIEMLSRTRTIKEVNTMGYFIGANGTYGNIEIIDKKETQAN